MRGGDNNVGGGGVEEEGDRTAGKESFPPLPAKSHCPVLGLPYGGRPLPALGLVGFW